MMLLMNFPGMAFMYDLTKGLFSKFYSPYSLYRFYSLYSHYCIANSQFPCHSLRKVEAGSPAPFTRLARVKGCQP